MQHIMYTMSKMEGIGKHSRLKLSKVISKSKEGLTPALVESVLSVNKQEAGRLLSRWEKAGWLQRIKRGFYISIPVEASPGELAIENPWAIVSNIFSPGYIAGFSAIKHWDLSEQLFETVVYFTTKKTNILNPNYSGIKIHLKNIKSEKLFGTKTIWIGTVKVQVSDPSRTMIDFLDDPSLAGGMAIVKDFFNNYLDSKYKNIPLLIQYAEKFGNQTVFKRLGFLCEVTSAVDEDTLEKIRQRISKGYSNFDSITSTTKMVRRWNLKVPISWMKQHD